MTRHLLSLLLVLILCAGVVRAEPDVERLYGRSGLGVGDWRIESSPAQRRVHPEGAVSGMAFAPGSRELAYCAVSEEGGSALWLAAIRDTREHLAFWDQYVESRPLWRAPSGISLSGPIWWSPEGGKLAVCVRRQGGDDVIGIDRLTGEAVTLVRGATVADLAWQMHGEQLAYAVESNDGRTVWLQTNPPAEPRCLGKGGFDLHWTLEGKLIWRRRDENWKLMSWDPVSAAAEEVETSVVPLSAVYWSPSGASCAELKDDDGQDPSLAIYEGNNSTPEVIPLPGAGPGRIVGWSPDSRLIVLLCQESHLLAVSGRPPGPGVVAMAEAKGGRAEDVIGARAWLMIWPAVDPRAGPPAWTSTSDSFAYVCPDEDTVLALYPRLRTRRFMEGAIPFGDIVVQGLKHTFVKAPPETEVERVRVTTNMKNVALAIQMYLADNHDIFPGAEDAEKLTMVLDEYVRDRSIFMRPGSEDELSFWYVIPAGLRLTAVRDPAGMPVAFVDYDPTFLVVAYADGHAADFDRTAEVEDALDAWWEEFQRRRAEDPAAQPPLFMPPS